ncbi:MAG: beta-ketoacyl-[acyl-carrier-protein] synthase family protein [Pirellulales bacterium]|nr:beta-ketoacyl-[acyl-carrier-protein] synthase family protein [Pirellulales bacterium]
MYSTDVVITGVGIVSPIGIGWEPFWAALRQGKSGIGRIRQFEASGLPCQIAAEVTDFDPKCYVRPRKSLKVMCRDSQMGVAASTLACQDAGIAAGTVDPERLGVVMGADRICSAMEDSEPTYRNCLDGHRFDFGRWGTDGMAGSFPLSFLKVLPNTIASHISIAHDARGPNNTIHQTEVSSLLAVGEAARVIQRGAADVMIVGGASSQLNPFDYVRRSAMGILTRRQDEPAAAMRPFDADRDGQVWGEGAAVFILEDARHAEARGARVLARILGWATTCEPRRHGNGPRGAGLRRAVELALRQAKSEAKDLGHVNAHGLSTIHDDQLEARALHEMVPEVPVVAPKSYFGNLGAAGGAMEMAASVLSLGAEIVPATLNYEHPDPNCPLQVICDEPLSSSPAPALLVNWTTIGQAASAVLAGPG